MAVTTELATTKLAETTQVELVIGGMTCAACAARVQAKLNKLTGVTASVNLSTERAYVSAPPTLPAAALIGVVEAAGCTIVLTGRLVVRAERVGADTQPARLGLALGSGTDVAITAADMILLRDDLAAAATMTLSSVFVVWNSLRLRRLKLR